MRKLLGLGVALLALLSTVGCGWTTISPGHVGIEVNMSGTDRGVSSYTTTTGRVFYNSWNTKVFEYPTFVQTYTWSKNPNEGTPSDESITFTTKDSMIVNADFNISYDLRADAVPQFYTKFRNDDISQFTYGYLHNVARNCINDYGGHYSVEQIMGDNAEFLKAAQSCIQNDVQGFGVNIDLFGLVGAPRPPDSVMSQINAKVQAQQIALQKQNEIVQAEADAKKRVAEAEGEALANERLTRSLTPTLLDWRRLAIQEAAVNKWNGQRPQVEGGTSGLLLQVH